MRARRHVTQIAAIALAATVALGCGSSDSYKNEPRPPAPIVLTASISKDRVSVSPATFGAGPVELKVANLTSSAQQITFEAAGGISQKTGPISPSDVATLKVDVPEGEAVLRVNGDAIRSAKITVGPMRESAQNQLLQP